MTDSLKPIAFAACGLSAAEFQQSILLKLAVDDAAQRLRQFIDKEDLWVLHEINPQMLLERGGYAIAPVRQILFFHPRLMIRVISADRAALLEAPLKFAIIGLAEGHSELRWIDPRPSFDRYQSLQLEELGKELSALYERIARAVAG